LLNDKEISKTAIEEGRIIITKDSDFLNSYILKDSPPKVILLQLGNISNIKPLDYFEIIISIMINLFKTGSEFLVADEEGVYDYKK
jgi:predicted nuclease of predicted toxin-antitoxin system